MCLGGLLLGYAVANMQLYRFAAVELAPGPFPRPGDLLCDVGRRDRRHRRADLGALDARPLDPDFPGELRRGDRDPCRSS
jgi:hypothetical protein